MSRPLVEQRRLHHRDREFHFVSYDAVPANEKKGEPAVGPSWFLMSAGTRWEVMPYVAGQDPDELDRAFAAWLDTHVFTSPDETGG